mgnify:CR=1 FL=1
MLCVSVCKHLVLKAPQSSMLLCLHTQDVVTRSFSVGGSSLQLSWVYAMYVDLPHEEYLDLCPMQNSQ